MKRQRSNATRINRASGKQRRIISLSISAPVFCTLEVERSGPDQDWVVARVRRSDVELSARGAMECMGQDDFIELERLANAAEDEP